MLIFFFGVQSYEIKTNLLTFLVNSFNDNYLNLLFIVPLQKNFDVI